MRNWNFYFTVLFCLAFSITTFAGGSAPMNNECGGAALLTVGTECILEAYTLTNATTSAISCSGVGDAGSNDIWFKAVAPASGNITFEWNSSSNFALIGGVFSSSDGTCDNLSPISCINSNNIVIVMGIPAGDMIFLQLRESTVSSSSSTLVNICASDASDIIPFTELNDCFSAPKIDILPTGSEQFTCYSFNIPNTTVVGNPFDQTGCGSLATVFKTTAPASGELTFTTNGGSIFDVAVTVLLGECLLVDGSSTKDGNPGILNTILIDCQDLNNGPSFGEETVALTGLTPGGIVCFLVYPVINNTDILDLLDENTEVIGSTDEQAETTSNDVAELVSSTNSNPISTFSDNIKVSLQSDLPGVFSNPEQLFSSQNEISFGDPCSCDDPRNCTDGGVQYFHDTLTIPAALTTTPGLTINVSSATNFFIDVPCFGAGLTNATNQLIPEVSPGVYKIEFWRPSGVIPTLAVTVNGGAPISAPAATFQPVCTTEACTPQAPIPTMSEWGLIIFGLLTLNLGLILIQRREKVLLK